jgi:WD40 repeat protein
MKKALGIFLFLFSFTLPATAQNQMGAIWNPDGTQILTWEDRQIAVQTVTGDLVGQIDHAGIEGAAWGDMGMTVLYWGGNAAMAWEIGTGEIKTLLHDEEVGGATWYQANTLSWAGDRLYAWDAAGTQWFSGQHDGRVAGAGWIDETRVVSWSDDFTIRVWNFDDDASIMVLRHDGPVTGAQWTEDYLLSWSEDGTARIWALETGASMGNFAHRNPVVGATWGQVPFEILTYSEGEIYVWHMTPEFGIESAWMLEHPGLSGASWDAASIKTWDTQGVKFWDAGNGDLVGQHAWGCTSVSWHTTQVACLSAGTLQVMTVESDRAALAP